jgi:hypothetical protein
MYDRLSADDKRSLRSVLKRTQVKLSEILPKVLERLADEG